ncbi:type IV secretion system protein [Wolbachia endosymbiont of Mansonella ozzardi]|uniref:type IV secretion system protein n=1 Tax=Wolbachia endosymbiont of Mansonella ozzardi TaxID=137464 RepID=UPI001CE0A697|nr:type IV secretion system protein [Wolbachia endosymbiont of Mansonella ozzardi]MCA4774846.1 type IV secretion system protein [Wolbachia endosymbiont of Mansonella ozzardi]
MFRTKLSLLLIGVFLLNVDFLLSYPAFADEASGTEKTEFVSRFNSAGSFSRASNPDCGAFKTAAALAGIAIAVGAIFTGIVLIVSSAGLFTFLVVVGMIAAVVGVWKAIGGLVVCQHSFVRHPVARDHDGKYKNFKLEDTSYSNYTDKNYQTEDEYFSALQEKSKKDGKQTEKEILNLTDWYVVNVDRGHYYWPKNGVQYSEYIEICHRNPLTFGNLFKMNDFDSRGKPGYIDFDVREKDTGYVDGAWSPKVDGDLECKVLKAGQTETIHGSTFKAVRKMGRLCVGLESVGTLGIKMAPWPQGVDMGCTELPPDPLAPMCDKSKMKFKTKDGTEYKVDLNGSGNKDKDYKTLIKEREGKGAIFVGYDNAGCFSQYVSEACYNQAGSKSLAPVPITSMVVQCIKESLDNLVAGHDSSGKPLMDEGGHEKGSLLSVAQKKLKNTVTAVLVLALILFSIKAMSGGVRSPQEMYILIIKFALVIYFTTGDTMSHYYGELTKLSNGLSEIVLKASSESKGICDYSAGTSYEYTLHTGKKVSYSYLAPWDRLDCRISFYLGAPLDGIGSKIGTESVGVLSVLLGAAPVLLVAGSIIGTIFAGGQILVALVCIFIAVMMIMVILWMCYAFILSLVALSVIIILSPLFIPMVLFQHTKGYFDGWLKELITYSLYPVMLFAFLSFMFIACDKIYFKNLNFEPDQEYEEKIKASDSSKKQWFKLKGGECDKNKTTLACMMQNYSFKKSSVLGLFDFTYMEFSSSLIGELLKLALILFLFYHFFHILPGMAAELSGNYRAALGSGDTPAKMMSKAFSAGKAIAGAIGKAKSGDAAGAAKETKKARDTVSG